MPAAFDLDDGQLGLYRATMGADHPSTLAAALNLAIDLRALGREPEAEALHQETVERYKRVLGVNHLATKEAADWKRANCDMDVMPL
ncbi:tetratricopeptide repeat protein [Catenuloplanes sp. NPDC051500]|uniref:tetratricopeptide repeat protein n=1 Tax=Catenuloplanes sp. NPDC051500 TaxID=3363959 RepID=UPI0037AEB6E8